MPKRQTDVLSEYLRTRVTDVLENNFAVEDFNQRKVLFLLSEFGIEPSEVKAVEYADGKIDAYALNDDESGTSVIDIWQLSGPDETAIRKGRVLTPPGRKLQNDLRGLVETLTKGQRRLSQLGAEAVVAIRDKIDQALVEKRHVKLRVHVLSLYKISDTLSADITAAAKASLKSLGNGSSLEVKCTVHGLEEYAASDAGVKRGVIRLEDLHLRLASPNAYAKYEDTYLVFASPLALVQYYSRHKGALLHSNARFWLGTNKANANKAIEATARDRQVASRFHELNNGLVVTCTAMRLEQKDGDVVALSLSSPQVVNGGQTLHTLHRVHQGSATEQVSPISRLAVPVKIVRVTGQDALNHAEAIAKASNTQAALSQRALASYTWINPRLQRSFAKLAKPWFFEKTDGEWDAFRNGTPAFRKSLSGHKEWTDFIHRRPNGGKKPRLIKNSELLEALLSAYGCLDDAKPKRVFESGIHPDILVTVLSKAGWSEFEQQRKPSRNVDGWKAFSHATANQQSPAFLWLVWSLFRSTRYLVQSEAVAREWVMGKAVEFGFGSKKPKNYEAWTEYTAKNVDAETLEWAEHVANAMQKPVVFEMLRLLARRYGDLNEHTCLSILQLSQFDVLFTGEPVDAVLGREEARQAKVGVPDTPIYTLFQICRHACGMLWSGYASAIRSMGTKQQTLLGDEWVERLSAHVDSISAKPKMHERRFVFGGESVATTLAEALPELDS